MLNEPCKTMKALSFNYYFLTDACVCVCVYSFMTEFICTHDHWINNFSVLPMP